MGKELGQILKVLERIDSRLEQVDINLSCIESYMTNVDMILDGIYENQIYMMSPEAMGKRVNANMKKLRRL